MTNQTWCGRDGCDATPPPPESDISGERCNCEHSAHFPPDRFSPGIQTKHDFMDVPAGKVHIILIGLVCDDCAETCMKGYERRVTDTVPHATGATPPTPDESDISDEMVLVCSSPDTWYTYTEMSLTGPDRTIGTMDPNLDGLVQYDSHWYIDGKYGFSVDQRICTDHAETGKCLGTDYVDLADQLF